MKKKKFKFVKFITTLGGLVFVLACTVALYIFGVASPLRTRVSVSVAQGASVSGTATRLQHDGIISQAELFNFAIRMHGGKIQRGEYEIPAGASVWRIAKMLSAGDVATTTIVIPEGTTIKQVRKILQGASALTGAAECNDGRPVCNLGDGDIFPDTYRVARGTSRLAVIDLAHKKMESLREKWERAGRHTPSPLKTWNDVVTLASIVQKETPRASEMPVVASVYLNRLRKNMRLQADPTVVYALTDGLGDMGGAPLLRGHLQIDSPYNTYMHGGLPPAPISNVGRAAISAVLNPADTNYLFFVADGRGGHKFANSYEEHKKNHADWRAIKKSATKN